MNPLAQAPATFWKTTGDIDLILAKTGSAQKPITPQLRRVSEINIDEIKRVATKVWGTEANTGPGNSIHWAQLNVSRARTDAGDVWRDSEAATNFKQYLTNVENWLGNAEDPVKAVGPALANLADKLEVKLSDIITQLGLAGGAVSAVIGAFAAVETFLGLFPEPVVTKAIAAALAAVFSTVVAVVAIAALISQMVTQESNQMAALNSAISKLKNVDRAT